MTTPTYNYDPKKGSWALHRKLLRAPNIGFNAEVQRWFKVEDDTPGRTALRDSLLITAKDSRGTAQYKIWYFREFVQKVQNKPAIIGIEKHELDNQISVVYKPQVILFFKQDFSAVNDDYEPVTARISFRLMNESSTTLTKANLELLATKIRNELATNSGYTFDKGKYLCKYHDKENGYDLQIYALNKAEGLSVARKIVGIQDHSFDESKFTVSEPEKNSINTTTAITILGESIKKPRWRPTAKVRFQYADLLIHGIKEPRCLVDRTWSRNAAIVKV